MTKSLHEFIEKERISNKKIFLSNYKKVLSKIDNKYISELKDIITSSCYNSHIGYISKDRLELKDYKVFPYPNNDLYSILPCEISENNSDIERIIELGLTFLRFDIDENFYYLVYQVAGVCEDDYSGYILIPLNDDTYWIFSFND